MPRGPCLFNDIEVTVSGFFTTRHRLATEAGVLGEFTFPAFASYASFRTVGGRELLMKKVHWLASAHELLDGETVLGTADKQTLFGREFAISYGGKAYLLVPVGLLGQVWHLADDDGTRLTELEPQGILSQGLSLTACKPISIELLAFAYYLVHVQRQEDSAAAAACAS